MYIYCYCAVYQINTYYLCCCIVQAKMYFYIFVSLSNEYDILFVGLKFEGKRDDIRHYFYVGDMLVLW